MGIKKFKIGKKVKNIFVVYSIIVACGIYVLFIDFVSVNKQSICLEKNLNYKAAHHFEVGERKSLNASVSVSCLNRYFSHG